MSTWKKPLLPSGKLSRPGRLVKALGHHTMHTTHCQCGSAPCSSRSRQEDRGNENIDPKSSKVYRLDNQFRRENADVVGDKPVKNDAGEMSMSEDSKQKAAWLEHYHRLLIVEFDWDPDHLSNESPVKGPLIPLI